MNATAPTSLPEIDDALVASMERTVFTRIAAERGRSRSRRRRWWTAGVAAAAVVVLAVAVAPWVGSTVSPTGTSAAYDAATAPVDLGGGAASMPESASGTESLAEGGMASGAQPTAAGGSREMISTGSATVVVDDVAAATEAIGAAAEARGGYVESMSVGAAGTSDLMVDSTMMQPYPGVGDGWITVRVPTAELSAAITELGSIGEVTSSSVSRLDVTDQAVDLRARIAASETSVARLTELMAQAESTADLIAAESALQERQAALDADRQQLASLDGQIDLASLSVQVTPRNIPVEADPAGFGDGVAAGWNGLIATLNAIVISFGFLLPWLGIAAAISLAVWGVIRLVRAARRPRLPAEHVSGNEH